MSVRVRPEGADAAGASHVTLDGLVALCGAELAEEPVTRRRVCWTCAELDRHIPDRQEALR